MVVKEKFDPQLDQSYIQFDGWSQEEHGDRDAAFNLAVKTYLLLARKIKKNVSLHIHVKRNNPPKKDGRIRYSIATKINSPGIFLEAKTDDWSFIPAVRESLQVLEREVIKKLEKKKSK